MESKKSVRHSLNLKIKNYSMFGTLPYVYVAFYSFPRNVASVF